jgi:hypothetical protein
MSQQVTERLTPIANYGADDDKDIVYFLVMLRRLIEPTLRALIDLQKQNGVQLDDIDLKRIDTYKILQMFVNWAVHPQLSHNLPHNRALLAAFDAFWNGDLTLHIPYISMAIVRSAIECVLVEEYIQPNITRDNQLFIKFISLYGGIIEGSPIEIRSNSQTGVSRIVITASMSGDGDFGASAALRWAVWNGNEVRELFGAIDKHGLLTWSGKNGVSLVDI